MATAVSGYNSGHNAVHGNNGSAMMMATGTSEMGTNGGGAHVAVPKRIGEMRLRLWYFSFNFTNSNSNLNYTYGIAILRFKYCLYKKAII